MESFGKFATHAVGDKATVRKEYRNYRIGYFAGLAMAEIVGLQMPIDASDTAIRYATALVDSLEAFEAREASNV